MTEDLTDRDRWALETMRRQQVVMDDAVAEAQRDLDPVGAARRWLGVEHQALAYDRYLAPWRRAAAFDRVASAVVHHGATMADLAERARVELAGCDGEVRAQAERRRGLRLAVVGKGGLGKSVLSATVARLLARRGRQVLAVDLDTNPGLAYSLGIDPIDAGLPEPVLEEDPGANYGWQLAGHVRPAEVVEEWSRLGPDGVRVLGLGKISSPDKGVVKQSVAALVQVLLGFDDPDWDVIADLEAGPTTPFERYHAFASDTLVVVGPSWRSAMTARRLWPMVAHQRPLVVGNRFGHEADHPGLPTRLRIPRDRALAEAERAGRAPIDVCPEAPAVQAMDRLVDDLLG